MTNGHIFINKGFLMSRILAIDYGLKRCGIAVTDPERIIATPLEAVHTGDLLKFLEEYFEKEKVDILVLGEPKNLAGSDTHTSQAVRDLTRELQKKFPGMKIHLVDERFTSKMALNAMIEGGSRKKNRRNKGIIDKISAAIILQSYLEQQNNLH